MTPNPTVEDGRGTTGIRLAQSPARVVASVLHASAADWLSKSASGDAFGSVAPWDNCVCAYGPTLARRLTR